MALIVAVQLLSAAEGRGGETQWMQLRSPNFEVMSGAGVDNGREVLRRMEQIRHVFETRTQRQKLTPLPVRIFVFPSKARFRPFKVSENAAGYYQPDSEYDYIAMEVTGNDLYRIVFHEYVHLLFRHAAVDVPLWFNEGTAEVYSTTVVSDREIRIGDPVPAHLATLRSSKLLDIPTLLAVDRRSPHYNERDKTGIFYAESWALAHMLNFSPEYQPHMPEFLKKLFAGEDPFGKSPAVVLSDLRKYIREDRFRTVRVPASKLQVGKLPAAQVSEVEATLALADLLLAIHRPGGAGMLLAEVALKSPGDARVEAALGDVAAAKKEDAVALGHYRRAIELGSPSARLRYDYAMLLREMRAPAQEVEAVLREAVQLDPRLSEARYLLDHLMLKESTPAKGRTAAVPAMAVDRLTRAEGSLTQVDCLGQHARLHVEVSGRRLFLLVEDPGSVVLRNAGGIWTEFTCGPVKSRSVLVEYRGRPNATYRTAGDVVAIEFR